MRRAWGVLVAAMLLAGCGVTAPSDQGTFQIAVDTPALRALKESAHIQTCPRTTAPATGGLPKATLPCLGGGPAVALASLRGPMVINLWAHWCAPCRKEMPHLEAFFQKYAGRVSVLGVDYNQDDPNLALGFAKSVGATYPMVADLAPSIRTASLPTTILLDAQGKVVYQRPIEIKSEAQLEQLVAQYLGVTP